MIQIAASFSRAMLRVLHSTDLSRPVFPAIDDTATLEQVQRVLIADVAHKIANATNPYDRAMSVLFPGVMDAVIGGAMTRDENLRLRRVVLSLLRDACRLVPQCIMSFVDVEGYNAVAASVGKGE